MTEHLKRMGQDVEVVVDHDEIVGHAGVIVRDANSTLECGTDPRSNGGVAAF
jgi:gamma-glutamyltranspeptidase